MSTSLLTTCILRSADNTAGLSNIWLSTLVISGKLQTEYHGPDLTKFRVI